MTQYLAEGESLNTRMHQQHHRAHVRICPPSTSKIEQDVAAGAESQLGLLGRSAPSSFSSSTTCVPRFLLDKLLCCVVCACPRSVVNAGRGDAGRRTAGRRGLRQELRCRLPGF